MIMKKIKLWDGFPALWLGFSVTAFTGAFMDDWQWWAICVPWTILQTIINKQNEEN